MLRARHVMYFGQELDMVDVRDASAPVSAGRYVVSGDVWLRGVAAAAGYVYLASTEGLLALAPSSPRPTPSETATATGAPLDATAAAVPSESPVHKRIYAPYVERP